MKGMDGTQLGLFGRSLPEGLTLRDSVTFRNFRDT